MRGRGREDEAIYGITSGMIVLHTKGSALKEILRFSVLILLRISIFLLRFSFESSALKKQNAEFLLLL